MITDAADFDDDVGGKGFDESAAQVVDHAVSFGGRRGAVQCGRLLVIALAWLVCGARGEDAWVLLPEAKFMGREVTRPVAGAKATVLAVARLTAEGPVFAGRAEWNAAEVTEAELEAGTARLAAGWLAAVEPELVRDGKRVLQYAVLRSETVPVSGAVLAREFWEKFEPLFGARMRVVVPNRNTVFIFPDVAKDLREHGPMVMDAWRSRWPKVSLEVLEVGRGGMKAVGTFGEP